MCFLTLRVGSEVFYYNRCLLPEKVVLNALWDSFSLLRVSVRHQVTCVLFLPEETSSTTDCFLLFVADVGGREAYASLLPCMKAKIATMFFVPQDLSTAAAQRLRLLRATHLGRPKCPVQGLRIYHAKQTALQQPNTKR